MATYRVDFSVVVSRIQHPKPEDETALAQVQAGQTLLDASEDGLMSQYVTRTIKISEEDED